MRNLNELLQQLSEIEPEVCRSSKYGIGPAIYTIGQYQFWFSVGTLCAKYQECSAPGDPAHAWLQGALQAECKRRHWYLSSEQWADGTNYECYIQNEPGYNFHREGDNYAHAILSAFVAAIRAAKASDGDAGE